MTSKTIKGLFNVTIQEINLSPTRNAVTYNGSGFCSQKRCFYSVQMTDFYLEEILEFDKNKNLTNVYSKKTYTNSVIYSEESYIKTHVTAVCDDGLVNSDSEQCDDKNLVNGDGCDEHCQIEQPTSIACTGMVVDTGIGSYFDYDVAHVSDNNLYDIATTASLSFKYYAASNNGGGYFLPQTVALTDDSYGITYVDIDNDGDLDILTAGPNGSIFSPNAVSLNNEGIFGPPVTLFDSNGIFFYGNKVVGGNFNRDNYNDALWFTSQQVYVAFGPYSFGPAISSAFFSTYSLNFAHSGNMNGALAADLDNDGNMDAIAALGAFSSGFNGELALLINTSEGLNLIEYSSSNVGFFSDDALNPQTIAAADFNNDGNTDIAFSNYSSNHTGLIIGLRTSADGDIPTYDFSSAYSTEPLSGLAAGDFNADGTIDLVAARNSGNSRLLEGHGNGSFTENECALNSMYSPKAADIDNDGHLDLVYNGGETITILFARSNNPGSRHQ